MDNRPSISAIWLPLLISLFGVLSFGISAWCSVSACNLGKYKAKVTLLETGTQKPVPNRSLQVSNSYGDLLFTAVEDGEVVITDVHGEADVSFEKSFNSPIFIKHVVRMPCEERITITSTGFYIQPEDIKANSVVPSNKIRKSLSGCSGTEDPVSIKLEIESWSLF